MKGKITIDRELCKGCAYCVDNCPKGLIEIDVNFNSKGFYPAIIKTENGCTACKLCAVTCPEIAIEVYKENRD